MDLSSATEQPKRRFFKPLTVPWRNAVLVAAFAPLGVLARIAIDLWFGLSCAQENPDWTFCITSDGTHRGGGALFIDLPSNMIFSFAMGLLASQESPRLLRDGLLSIGLRTGFCGSATSFASWIFQVVDDLMKAPEGVNVIAPRLKSAWPDALAALLIGTMLPLSSYQGGHHLAHFIGRTRRTVEDRANGAGVCRISEGPDAEGLVDPTAKENRWRKGQRIILVIGFLFIVAQLALFLGLAIGDGRYSAERRSYWLACLFGFVGALTRYVLAHELNSIHSWLPLGTLAANIIACVISFITYAVIDGSHQGAKVAARTWGPAIRLGLSGSLSTVSTWVHELDGLGKDIYRTGSFRAYTYALMTIIPSVCLGLAIYGWALR